MKQAGKIAQDDIIKRLAAAGYNKTTLVDDDFPIKYNRNKDLDNLLTAMRQHYTIKCNKNAKQYSGFNLKWEYVDCTCIILFMDRYMEQALNELKYPPPSKPYHSPSYCGTPTSCA